MLVEAGVHYYNATGKTKLLEVATCLTNYMIEEHTHVIPELG